QPRIERQHRMTVRDFVRRYAQMLRVFEASDIAASAPALDAFDDLFRLGLRQRQVDRVLKILVHRAPPSKRGGVLSQDAADASEFKPPRRNRPRCRTARSRTARARRCAPETAQESNARR